MEIFIQVLKHDGPERILQSHRAAVIKTIRAEVINSPKEERRQAMKKNGMVKLGKKM